MTNSKYKDIYGKMDATITHQKCILHDVKSSSSTKENNSNVMKPPSTSNDTRIINNSTQGKNIGTNRSRVIKWANRCEYTCQECKQVFKSFSTLIKKHVHHAHGLTKSAYTAHHGKEMTLKSYHQCQICGCQIVHTFVDIVQHLKKTHHCYYTIDTYHQEYIEQNGLLNGAELNNANLFHQIALTVDPNVSKAKVFPHVKLENCSITNFKKKEVLLQDNQDSKDILFKDWIKTRSSQKITEMCRLCKKKITRNSTFLRLHLEKKCSKNHNKILVREYFERYYYSEMINFIQFQCNLDQQPEIYNGVWQNKGGIEDGLSHSTSEESTHLQYTPSITNHDLNNTLTSNDNNIQDTLKDCVPTDCTHSSLTANVSSLDGNNLQDSSLTSSMEKYFNKCAFSCDICNERLSSKKRFMLHISTMHDMTYTEYVNGQPMEDSDPMVLCKLYKCRTCGEEGLIHDAMPIEKHLQEKHGSSLEDYFTKYNVL